MITVTDTTKNSGAGIAPASSTGFYLSVNGNIDASDIFIGSRSVGELAPGASLTGSVSLQIPANTAPGTYVVMGRADWNNTIAEPAETNNDRASGGVAIGGDLLPTAVSSSATGMANGFITVTDTTKNQGTAAVPQSETGFYLSTNGSYSASDVFIGSRVVEPLIPSQSSSASTQVLIPPGTAAGIYYVLAVADWNAAVAESKENNNIRYSNAVSIGPDLIVTTVTTPSSAVAGSTITVSDTTKNQGGDTAASSGAAYYLSSNSVLDANDVLLATRTVSSLGPGLSDTGSIDLAIPETTTAGTRYIIVKADGGSAIAEASETNNTKSKSISIAAAP
jgi:subtilase family serine protease